MAVFVSLAVLVAIGVTLALRYNTFPVLNPSGAVGVQQRDLLLFTVGLMLLVIVPVFAMLGIFAWKYRAGGRSTARYTPEWSTHRGLETLWWGVPIVLISILAVVTWRSSHELDPSKSLSTSQPPLKVQVVALQWKWLFIYPDYGVASVNRLDIPTDTPVEFSITSDAPMNSFWIPSLGGQIYAMAGMHTSLNLVANKVGIYDGLSANISGKDFEKMKFKTFAQSRDSFEQQMHRLTKSGTRLDDALYLDLARPSTVDTQLSYGTVEHDLFARIVSRYSIDMPTSHSAAHQPVTAPVHAH